LTEPNATRQRLAAILAADAAGYSRLMSVDERSTIAALDAARRAFKEHIDAHQGHVIDMAGDSVLAVFDTATGAVSAALAVQARLDELAAGVPADRRMRFRIGVHMGDVIEKADGTVYGDGVNIAARLEGLALPGGITVSDAVQGAVRNRIAARFEDLGEQQVKNIVDPVRVYRVLVPGDWTHTTTGMSRARSVLRRLAVRRWMWAALAAIAVLAATAAALVLSPGAEHGPPALSVAVLPFKAPAAADEAFAESFTRDLTAALGRSLAGSRVASGNAVATYRGKAVDGRAIGKDLNVRYLLEGEAHRMDDRVAIVLQLFDARNAQQLWSERIETPAAKLREWPDLPVVKSTLAARIALAEAEGRRLTHSSVRDADPLELVFRAWQAYDGTFEGAMKAKALCEAALRADPELAPALYCKAGMIVESLDLKPSPQRAQLVAEADDLTRRAIALASNDSNAWGVRGEALRLQHQWEGALEANARAIQLDPSRVSNLSNRGYYMIWTGRPAEALPLVARSEAINPANVGFDQRVACRAYIALGRFDEAVRSCERSAVVDEWWSMHLYLAAAYAQKGETAKAAVERDKAIARKPEATIAWYGELLSQLTDNALYLQQYKTFMEPGLRKAGFPEK
jgi:adenylate cyclase